MKIWIIIALFLLVAGCTVETPRTQPDNVVPEPTTEDITVELPPALPPEPKFPGYKGELLAGKNSPYFEFSQVDYDKAIADGKVVLLVFYSSTSSSSVTDDEAAQEAFDELDTDKIVGFRVRFNDTGITEDEEKIALKFAVSGPKTKIFIRYGEKAYKSVEQWTKARYLEEIPRNI